MSNGQLHLFRRVFGFVLALIGLGTLVSDLIISFQAWQRLQKIEPLHMGHMAVAAVLLFIGGYLLNPPDAEAIADAITKRLPVFKTLWPGGMRATDPPPEPGVAPPPSVTGNPPPPPTA